MNHFLRKGDFWSGFVLASLGGYIVYESLQWEYATDNGPGPGFFPIWYGIIMLAISLLLMLGAVLKKNKTSPDPVDWASIRRVGLSFGALVISISMMKYIGFYMSFALLVWVLTTALFSQSIKKATIVSISGAFIFYLIFSAGLSIDLPVGELIADYL